MTPYRSPEPQLEVAASPARIPGHWRLRLLRQCFVLFEQWQRPRKVQCIHCKRQRLKRNIMLWPLYELIQVALCTTCYDSIYMSPGRRGRRSYK